MARTDQVRGLLLEEVALWLLQLGGYRPVFSPDGDPTLCRMSGGLGVKGRGTDHQVDAVGDFIFAPPYGHPIRLLVEGKAPKHGKSIGVSVVREAMGVVQDVSQYWTGTTVSPRRSRYHYQSAIFSTVKFSEASQKLAFAHDVFLFPLGGVPYLSSVMKALAQAVESMKEELPGRGGGPKVDLTLLRNVMRRRLNWFDGPPTEVTHAEADSFPQLDGLIEELGQLQGALLGMAGRTFPVFLVPSPQIDLRELPHEVRVEIGIQDGEWYLRNPETEEALFAFDLPIELVQLHASDGTLGREERLLIKGSYLNEIHASYRDLDELRVFRFSMDQAWFEDLLEGFEGD